MLFWFLLVFTTAFTSYNRNNCVYMFRFPRLIGKYDLVAKEIINCAKPDSDKDFELFGQLSRNPIGKTVASINATLNRDYGMNETGIIRGYMWGNGGWKLVMKYTHKSMCEKLLNKFLKMDDVQDGVVEYFGIERNKYCSCPINKGSYTGRNISIDKIAEGIRKMVSVLTYGKFKNTFENYSDGKMNMCIGLIVDVVPQT